MGAMVRSHRSSSRAIAAGGALALAIAALGACSGSGDGTTTATDRTCGAAQALSASPSAFTGVSLAPKQLALTFDDGPSSKTLELSAYLKSEGIRAAFFVNGHCFVAGNPCGNAGLTPAQVFPQVRADGHIIGNHTQDHYDLTNGGQFPIGAAGDGALVKELTDTDAIIAPYVDANRFLFRPPYGAWSARDYTVLHAGAMNKYVGPVRWDIGGQMTGSDATGFAADWDCWQNLDRYGVKTTKQCGTRYLNEFVAVGRGVSLMHDADYGNIANHDINNGKGNTLDMVKFLVPLLKAQGFTFVRLDEVPDLAAALPPLPADADGGADSGSDAGGDGGPPHRDGHGDASASDGSTGLLGSPVAPPDPCAPAASTTQEFPPNAHVH